MLLRLRILKKFFELYLEPNTASILFLKIDYKIQYGKVESSSGLVMLKSYAKFKYNPSIQKKLTNTELFYSCFLLREKGSKRE